MTMTKFTAIAIVSVLLAPLVRGQATDVLTPSDTVASSELARLLEETILSSVGYRQARLWAPCTT